MKEFVKDSLIMKWKQFNNDDYEEAEQEAEQFFELYETTFDYNA